MAASLPTGDYPVAAPWHGRGGLGLWRAVLLAVAGALAIAVTAKVQLPFWPVPLTLQSLAVLVLGAVYGPALSAATVLLYLTAGLCGLPVFAGSGHGTGAFQGPTGGFLIGFLLAAPSVGWLVRRAGLGGTLASAGLVMLVGHAVLFIPGLNWLARTVGMARAVGIGLTPFVAAIALKIVVGAVLIRTLPRVS